MRTNVRTERLGGEQFDPSFEQRFQEEGQLHERIKRLGPRLELHQHIDITLAPLLLADKGAKYAQAAHPKGADVTVMLVQECQDLLFCLYCHDTPMGFDWYE